MKLTKEHQLYIEFAIGCGYRVLNIFEKRYPEDKRPRLALEAAWNFLVKPTRKNKAAAYAAAYAADDAAYAADDAAYAAYAAADDAAAAAYAAYAADDAAYAADDAAYAAADERKWQFGFLSALNVKYQLNIQINGVRDE